MNSGNWLGSFRTSVDLNYLLLTSPGNQEMFFCKFTRSDWTMHLQWSLISLRPDKVYSYGSFKLRICEGCFQTVIVAAFCIPLLVEHEYSEPQNEARGSIQKLSRAFLEVLKQEFVKGHGIFNQCLRITEDGNGFSCNTLWWFISYLDIRAVRACWEEVGRRVAVYHQSIPGRKCEISFTSQKYSPWRIKVMDHIQVIKCGRRSNSDARNAAPYVMRLTAVQ